MDDHGGILQIDLASLDLNYHLSMDKPDLKPGRYVMLTVKDSGTGIDEKAKALGIGAFIMKPVAPGRLAHTPSGRFWTPGTQRGNECKLFSKCVNMTSSQPPAGFLESVL
ncbi:MAG TPA: hypothetical protein DCZ89_08610 [Geobacter sulfurreducens]|nr:hypothetical protein [Geobacter sulfurreducens]HBG19000.1 hypothetical protein [Desulfobulbaceae bacterium]